jgi:hypothetical protein
LIVGLLRDSYWDCGNANEQCRDDPFPHVLHGPG